MKKPWLATGLNLMPGIGYLYLGRPLRLLATWAAMVVAAVFGGAVFVVLVLIGMGNPDGVEGIVLLAVWLLMVFAPLPGFAVVAYTVRDARRIAKAHNSRLEQQFKPDTLP
ncbi:MAG: hypothetical protein HY681_00370 [Chloroflexi bacterium]|nr:hypothetical protein [Chloroflexota bacterium]